jgi:hypothetical protein
MSLNSREARVFGESFLNVKRFARLDEGGWMPTREVKLGKCLVGSPARALSQIKKIDSSLLEARMSFWIDRLVPCE